MKQLIFVFALSIIFTAAGCSEKQEENVEKAVPVKIYNVRSESISKYIRVTGSVSGDEDVIVYSKYPERVEKILAAPGQRVAKDQVIAVQKNDLQKQSMEMAAAALSASEAQAALASQEFDRMNKLFAQKAVSPQQYDQAKTAKETSAQAFKQASSAYAQAKEQFDDSFIKAPFGGIVAAVFPEENDMLNAGQPVAQVISNAKMKARVYLTGAEINQAKAGQKVMLKFPAIENVEFTGRVDKINTAIDQMSKSLEVEIGILTADSRLKSGMFGEFYIETENYDNSIVVPETALLPQTEVIIDRVTGLQNSVKKYFIFTVDNGTAKMKEVKVGISNNGQIRITSGLSLGDSVIVIGQNIVKEGQTVKVIE